MASTSSIQAEIVKKYLLKFPATSKKGLAQKIFKENNLLFKNAEAVRTYIRYYTGSIGQENKNKIQDKSFIKESKFSPQNPYGLPESDEAEFTPYVLPVAANNILALFDIHAPYHNVPALTAAMRYGEEQKINTIIIVGDGMDCYHASFHEKDPRKRRLKGEFEVKRSILLTLRRRFPNAKIYYKEGNHEERWQRLLRVKAAEILDMDEFRLDVILRLGELGIEWIPDKRIIHAGKLNIMHGHEFKSGISAPVNPARGYYMKAKESMIAGHNHQTSEHTEPSLNGSIVTTWSAGCLCELHPQYMPINKWNHGFAHILVNKDKSFTVKNIRIINGKIV